MTETAFGSPSGRCPSNLDEDVAAAAGWLCSAFGFRESGDRYTDDAGRITHVELELDGARQCSAGAGRCTARRATTRCRARRPMALAAVRDRRRARFVNDVDSHLERAPPRSGDSPRPKDEP